ncbi:MAG: hypothetical protein KJZ80_11625 [Hyphomicrobiaceae bacterium]|nr:hypothetical protein [Hyphomicrobiaceae bacterium]
MPQVLALVLAGAGLYAGYRWLSREIRRAVAAAGPQDEPRGGAANVRGAPRDLGALEWDEKLGAYRPSRQA